MANELIGFNLVSTFWALVALLSLIAIFGSLFLLPFKSLRRKAKIVLALSLGAFLVSFLLFALATDQEAVTAGFESSSDRSAAIEAGYSDPTKWKIRKSEIVEQKKKEAEEQQRIEAAKIAEKEQREAEQRAAQEAQCRGDIHCWGEKFLSEAGFTCGRYVERLARNDFEWTNASFEPKVSHLRWRDKPKGVVTYIGDKIKFQNGFGAWIIHTYECDFDTNAKKVLDVRARPGRIPLSD